MVSRFSLGHSALCYGTRAIGSSAIVMGMTLGLLSSCSKASGSAQAPTSAWAQSLEAQREARIIESAWHDGTPSERQATLPLMLRFLEHYSEDPLANVMRLRMAWLKIEARDLDAAEALLTRCTSIANGVDADMAQVLRASILARRGQPVVALAHLRGLGGGLVDPETRELWAEQALHVAHLARSAQDAFDFMLAWRTTAVDEHQQRVEREITAYIERFDVESRLLALEALTRATAQPSAEESRHRARLWLLERIRASLGSHAVTSNDSRLARTLVANAPTTYLRSPDGEKLRRLAHALDVRELSMHASIGMLLELDNARASRESAELVTGAMRALATVGTDEPIRLITRELRTFEAQEVEHALASLVEDGAALLLAGLSPRTATVAAHLAETHRIAVILLTHPGDPVPPSAFEFFVESPDAEVVRIFREGADGSQKTTQLTSNDAFCRTEERLGWTPEFLTSRGHVLVATDASCAMRLATELRNHEGRVKVWLGPDATRAIDAFEDVTVITSTPMSDESFSKPLADWFERFQRAPSWYEALGYDVTRLGIEAIRKRGFDSLRGATLVRAGREQIRAALGVVKSDLLTTSNRGFGENATLSPTLVARRRRAPSTFGKAVR